jgi:hypothetical protein
MGNSGQSGTASGGNETKPILLPMNTLTAETLLTDCITQIVHPASWVVNGAEGEMACIGGVLIVCSSELIASDTEDFLVDLEFQLKKQSK